MAWLRDEVVRGSLVLMAWRRLGAGLLLAACAAPKQAEPSVMVAPALPPAATGAIADDKPGRARLMMLRGEASEIADAPQAAAEAYSAAIVLAPDVPRYYLRLAELYRSVRAERDAEAVLLEGLRWCRGDDVAALRGRMLQALASIARERGDTAAATAYVADAERLQTKQTTAASSSRGESTPVDASSPRLPAPKIELPELRVGDAFTVFGASYFLRSRHHRPEVNGQRINVQGYIVKTNLPDAPPCAVHGGGIADPEDCRAEIPTFWLGDRPDTPLSEAIPVLGFASNFAQIYEAIVQVESGKEQPYIDSYWGQPLPNPLPARGAEVAVSGRYGPSFSKATSGAVENHSFGILDFDSMVTLTPSPVPATLPGVRRK